MRISVDGKWLEVDGEKTILDICKGLGIKIPTLCYHKSLFPEARCRLCLVDLDGKLVTACSTKVGEGSKIVTNSKRVLKAKFLLEDYLGPLPLSHHLCRERMSHRTRIQGFDC